MSGREYGIYAPFSIKLANRADATVAVIYLRICDLSRNPPNMSPNEQTSDPLARFDQYHT